MKNTLGKILLILIFEILSFANADLATYTLKANKTDVYLKEAVEITFEAKQKNHADNMFFFLEPVASQEYKIELLQKTEEELSYHDKKTTFTYLLFPLKEGEIHLNFDFTIKVASDKAVAQVYQGSRDNVKWMETINTKMDLKPLSLHVKEISKDTELIGDFTLTSSLQNERVKEYENANITYNLEGVGYDTDDIHFIDRIESGTIFSDISHQFNKATKNGYEIKRKYNYALVANKDFSIPKKEIKCYSPKQNKYYTIGANAYTIQVDKVKDLNLIDKVNYPEEAYNFEGLKNFFIYIAIFITGFVTAKLFPTHLKYAKNKNEFSDIKESKTPNALLLLLMDKYKKENLEKTYNDLEALLYKNDTSKSFNTIKKELLKIIRGN